MLNWAGNPPDSVTPGTLANQVAATSMRYQQYSYLQLTGWTTTALGPLTVAAPPFEADGSCGWDFMSSLRNAGDAAAASASLDPDRFDAVLFYFPRVTQCGWTVRQRSTDQHDPKFLYLNGASRVENIAQALGMAMLATPAHSLVCTDAAGRPTPLSTDCRTLDTDPYNVLGGGVNSPGVVQKFQAGWLTGTGWAEDVGQPSTRYGTGVVAPDMQTGTSTIEPLEEIRTPGPFGEHVAQRWFDGATELWLEYRQPIGVDAGMRPASDGLLVYLATHPGCSGACPVQSNLLDMTPGADGRTFNDAVLRVGQSWRNPLGHARITVISAGPGGVQVSVTYAS
jgi:hypothetical protein